MPDWKYMNGGGGETATAIKNMCVMCLGFFILQTLMIIAILVRVCRVHNRVLFPPKENFGRGQIYGANMGIFAIDEYIPDGKGGYVTDSNGNKVTNPAWITLNRDWEPTEYYAGDTGYRVWKMKERYAKKAA